jgi:ATP-dependent exoDNAse (exonuclease V) alpha subunit
MIGQLVEPNIFPVLRRFKYKSKDYTRENFPLRATYAMTVHKSQGLMLKKIILNFNHKVHAAGISYVTISRVKRVYP